MLSAVVALEWSTMLARVPPADEPRDLERERVAVLQAQDGDRGALGNLLLAHGGTLYRTVLLPRLGSEAAAKDALAETYAKAVARIGQFRWQGVGFYPWLRMIGLRVALDMLRARGKLMLWDEDDLAHEIDRAGDDDTPDQRLTARRDEQAARAKVEDALGQIHPRYARAIRLRLLEEQTREDAARLLEVTPATFDVLFHRAVGALKKHLGATAAGTDLGGATRP
jgi:RNA polymerase sigma factor (sigma-70 family)